MSEKKPTEAELELALDDLIYVACQCATYHYWFLVAKQTIPKSSNLPDGAFRQLIDNGVIEVTLLFIRKTTEFFKPKKDGDRNDTIYSYRYDGYSEQENIIDEDLESELHKRVGHITIMQARYGGKQWPIPSMVLAAAQKWADFFEWLGNNPSLFVGDHTAKCRFYANFLRAIHLEINSKVPTT